LKKTKTVPTASKFNPWPSCLRRNGKSW